MSAEIKMFEQIVNFTRTGRHELYPDNLPEELQIFNLAQAKLVIKPWGFEIWIADGSEGSYAFKIIGLKNGTKTSLQYHKEKREHNFILSGKAILYYEDKDTGEIVSSQELGPGHIIYVNPPGVHRIEALTDLILIEASSPQLDDVIRIQDDTDRPNGRIEQEHRKI